MYIVSGQKFLSGVGASSLAGRLLMKYGEQGWMGQNELKEF
jgi:hypothetical protein